jgi:redox-sensitive bicupin YhaK (pirin superfamily)
MIKVRRNNERGHADHGWLNTYHTFSFAGYYDPDHMGFRSLRVINEDRVAPGAGFPTHPHRDMEILTYVVEGGLAHKDSMGSGAVIRPGEIQKMTAGSGVTHSEFNASDTEPVHLLQIWIEPNEKGLTPSYDQIALPERSANGSLELIAGPERGDHAVEIHQDARVYRGLLAAESEGTHELGEDRHAYVQVIRGSVTINGQALVDGDGAALSDEASIDWQALEDTELLLFDLA